MLAIFIGVSGGTLAHGIVGLFVGPIIPVVGWEFLGAWLREGISAEGAGMDDPVQRNAGS